MKRIINLTQHPSTPEQRLAGVLDIGELAKFLDDGDRYNPTVSPEKAREKLVRYLSFSSLPDKEEIEKSARMLADLASQVDAKGALIGGAPYLMRALEDALMNKGIVPLYSFTERISVEETLPDGSVKKTSVFKHIGFVGGGEYPIHDLKVEGMVVENSMAIIEIAYTGDDNSVTDWRPEFKVSLKGGKTILAVQINGKIWKD